MSEKKENVACPVCDTVGQWENVDEYTAKPNGLHMCKHCGTGFYAEKYLNEDEAKAYYEQDYRQPPTYGNATTGQRKNHMHAHFLTDTFKQWQDKKLEDPVVCDVGAAYGMFLNFVGTHFPKADLNGTEFAKAYRRNAYHEYGIELTKDFDKTKKYDLISSFKVAEHQLDVKKRLIEYKEALKEDGVMYISVPCWFGAMTNFGLDGFDLGYYYHPDHINVWSRNNFEQLLKSVGFEVIKYDGIMYDDTYLCKRNDALMNEELKFDSPDKNREILKKIKLAYEAYMDRDFKKAIEIYPNYFEAHQAYYESNRKAPHDQSKMQPLEYIVENHLKPCFEACGESLNALRMAVDIYMRYDHFNDAVKYINKALAVRPNNGSFLMALHHCLRQISLREKDKDRKIKLLAEARDVARYVREVDLQSKVEATNWIYSSNADLPTPSELESLQ